MQIHVDGERLGTRRNKLVGSPLQAVSIGPFSTMAVQPLRRHVISEYRSAGFSLVVLPLVLRRVARAGEANVASSQQSHSSSPGKVCETDRSNANSPAMGRTEASQNTFIRPEIDADLALKLVVNASRRRPCPEVRHVNVCEIHTNSADLRHPWRVVNHDLPQDRSDFTYQGRRNARVPSRGDMSTS